MKNCVFTYIDCDERVNFYPLLVCCAIQDYKSEIVTVLFQNGICPAEQCYHSESCDIGRFGGIMVIYGHGWGSKIGIGKEHC